jgi:hypothetical protein
LERIQKEMLVDYFKVLSPGRLERNSKYLRTVCLQIVVRTRNLTKAKQRANRYTATISDKKVTIVVVFIETQFHCVKVTYLLFCFLLN